MIDAQEPYSVGLANIVQRVLERNNVTVQRQSVTNNTTDFSSNVTRIPSDTDVVFTPFQSRGERQPGRRAAQGAGQEGSRLRRRRHGRPGLQDTGLVHLPVRSGHQQHADLSTRGGRPTPGSRRLRSASRRTVRCRSIAHAAKRACAKKTTVTRASLRLKMKSGAIPNWILGGTFRFSTKTNDPLNGGYWLYQVQSDGSQKQIARLG